MEKMKKFVFIPKKILNGYNNYTNKKQFQGIALSDLIKISTVSLWIIVTLFYYLMFVNLSSTKWYFLKQANRQLDLEKFNYEILKIKILEHEKENRDKLDFPTKETPIKIIEISKDSSK